MPRAAIPEIDKLKQRIIELPPLEAEDLALWLDAIIDVREQDRKLAEKRKTAHSLPEA